VIEACDHLDEVDVIVEQDFLVHQEVGRANIEFNRLDEFLEKRTGGDNCKKKHVVEVREEPKSQSSESADTKRDGGLSSGMDWRVGASDGHSRVIPSFVFVESSPTSGRSRSGAMKHGKGMRKDQNSYSSSRLGGSVSPGKTTSSRN
jgi:hypothetical protein